MKLLHLIILTSFLSCSTYVKNIEKVDDNSINNSKIGYLGFSYKPYGNESVILEATNKKTSKKYKFSMTDKNEQGLKLYIGTFKVYQSEAEKTNLDGKLRIIPLPAGEYYLDSYELKDEKYKRRHYFANGNLTIKKNKGLYIGSFFGEYKAVIDITSYAKILVKDMSNTIFPNKELKNKFEVQVLEIVKE
jgi:hypothetical protein